MKKWKIWIKEYYIVTYTLWGRGSIAGDNPIEIILPYTLVFNEYAIWYFKGMVNLFKNYPLTVPKNCFDSFNRYNETSTPILEFSFAAQDK